MMLKVKDIRNNLKYPVDISQHGAYPECTIEREKDTFIITNLTEKKTKSQTVIFHKDAYALVKGNFDNKKLEDLTLEELHEVGFLYLYELYMALNQVIPEEYKHKIEVLD